MGITGLLPFLQKSSRKANIKEFSGGTVAIDAYCWLHKGAFACADKLVMTEATTTYINYCMKYVNMLLSHNIKPILVFDGQNLQAKSMTESKRRQNRESNRRKGMELIRAGRVSEGRNILRRAVDVTHEMAVEVMRECRKRNVDCIVAPYEADAQLAYFSIMNIAQVILTEDSDLMLFGCKTVMFKMDINGNGVVVESNQMHLSMNIRSDQFTLDKFRLMCILSGCDYVESLPGIGLAKACKFVTKTSESDVFLALDKLPANLNMWTLEVTDEYKERVLAADRTFRCQLVFNPVERRLVPLTEPRVGETCVGEMKEPDIALEMALGNLNPRDLSRVENFKPSKSKHSIWANGYKSPKPKAVLPTIMRFATAGQSVKVSAPVFAKRNIDTTDDDERESHNELLEIYKKPKVETTEKTLSSRYFSSNTNEKISCLDSMETDSEIPTKNDSMETDSEIPTKNMEENDLFIEDEISASFSLPDTLTSTDPETELTSSGESVITISDASSATSSRESSQSTPTSKLGLKVFQTRKSTSSLVDDMTDTVGTDCSVFFGHTKLTPKVVQKPSQNLRVGLKRRKPLQQQQQQQQSSLANFGFQIRPKISTSSVSPS